MNTNALKRFAREARIKLIDQVGRKLEFVLSNTEPVFIDTNASQIQSLKNKVQAQGKEQVIDTVAYTWFNRLMALRFMDANGYTSPKVVTPVVGKSPEILQNALSGQIDENLKINRQRLNDLLDGKVVIADAQTEAYKMLLIAACNQWHSAMPFMFERISDYTELLLPDDLLSENSIIRDIRNGMSDDDCGQEELIGWLYQFYIADKKDDVFEGLKKNIKITAENIPAATQLFTPRWIVRYMVENTLGKLWLTLKPNSKLRQFMPYYIEAPEGNAPAPLPEGIKGVTDITFLDPCQGSGHVLVYAFDLFTKIYEEEGYNTNEIPALILEHNLFGIDIDERAAQLAAFALTMKARSYFPRFLRKPTQPNVIALENVNEETIRQSIKLPININGTKISDYKELSLNLLTQADNFGSLIQIAPEEVNAIQINEGSIWAVQQQKLKDQAEYLSRQYHCVVTNPPYMGDNGMNTELKTYLRKHYPKSRTDLLTCFMDRAISYCLPNYYWGMINLPSWMFLSSFLLLRKELIKNTKIDTLLHLGRGIFGSDFGSIAFTIQNRFPNENEFGVYRRLFQEHVQVRSVEKIRMLFLDRSYGNYLANQKDFESIAGSPIAYWINKKIIKCFQNDTLDKKATLFQGIITGNNAKFLRSWFEVSLSNINLGLERFEDFKIETGYWVPYNKGGNSRKWYGNQELIVNFSNKGKDFTRGKLQFSNFFFKPCFSWTYISSKDIDTRYFPNGFIWDVHGSSAFPFNNDDIFYFLSLIGTKVGSLILKIINPTISFQVENIAAVPIIYPNDKVKSEIVKKVKDCIEVSKADWDSRETSWAFKQNEIVKQKLNSLKLSFNSYQNFWMGELYKLAEYENKLNITFIEIYDLKDDLTPDLKLEDITILQEETKVLDNELFIDPIPVLLQLLSYSIGCKFGRYSLDKPSLILANQGETLQDFLKQVPNPSFMPDEDNIIPVLEGEWFNDDIVGRFKVFLKVAFGEEHFEENLKYIEDTIGKDIRKYFVKDFYNDHIKRYKKRPIYWMFSSPKGHFKALIYMHRYTPDLCSKMLADYLQSYIHKMEVAQQNNIGESLREDLPARDRTAATKEADRFSVMIKDCKEYAQTLYAVATKKIAIDLDDGVKVNYQKFKEVLVPIKGLEKEEE